MTAAGSITMDKGEIMKTIYEDLLIDDTSKKESVGTRLSEFGFKCGFSRTGCLRGQI